MKEFIRILIGLGALNWLVSVYEFVFYRKASGSLILATFLLTIGFGGLFVYNRVKGKKIL